MSRVLFEADPPVAVDAAPRYATAGRDARRSLAAIGLRVLSVLLIFALWELASRAVTTNVVPTPAMTVRALQDALGDGYVWSDMLVTFGRMIAAFGLAMTLAIVFGVALGTVGWFGRMFDFWVTIAASVPS